MWLGRRKNGLIHSRLIPCQSNQPFCRRNHKRHFSATAPATHPAVDGHVADREFDESLAHLEVSTAEKSLPWLPWWETWGDNLIRFFYGYVFCPQLSEREQLEFVRAIFRLGLKGASPRVRKEVRKEGRKTTWHLHHPHMIKGLPPFWDPVSSLFLSTHRWSWITCQIHLC